MFDIRKSDKSFIDAREQFIVVRQDVVYLRIVGEEGGYTVMTATAGEDDGGFRAFEDQAALNQAALRTSEKFGPDPNSVSRADFAHRPFINICYCDFLSDAYRAAVEFFAELDGCETCDA